MKKYNYSEEPLKIFGVPFFEQTKKLERLPERLKDTVPNLYLLGRRVTGARLCFRTDSPKFVLHMVYDNLKVDVGMSIFQCQSSAVFIGERANSRFAGIAYPSSYEDTIISTVFEKSDDMEDVTIWLPRNAWLTDLYIEVEEGAEVLPPTPYRYSKPIVYYGSSITEAAHARSCNGYNGLISRWLDVDFYNLGFSGSAKGEKELAQYIAAINKSIFVYDYDFNAPNVRHLEDTHEPFFKIIRESNPNLPIIMMSRPNFKMSKEDEERLAVVRRTYDNAVAAGDKNVYFVDGATYFDQESRPLCTSDMVHPNELGHYFMAKTICPMIRSILEAGC